MRQAGLKPKSHSSGIYWTRANSTPNGSNTSNEPFGLFEIFLLIIAIPIILLSLPLFLAYEAFRMISDRG